LHRHDRDQLPRGLDRVDSDIRQPDVPDLALCLQIGERTHRLLERHRRVDAVELVQVDPLEPEPPEALLAGLAQVRGPAIGVKLPGPGSNRASVSDPTDLKIARD
jgi:hypothetical protein